MKKFKYFKPHKNKKVLNSKVSKPISKVVCSQATALQITDMQKQMQAHRQSI